jgi:putative endonuclease
MCLREKALGQHAEDLALKNLKKKRLRVLERNWRINLGEIDLIAKKKKVLVFVEVKAGTHHPDFDPSDHLNGTKKNKLLTLAKAYLSKEKELPFCRFDLITVVQKDGTYALKHFEDVIEDRLQ